MVIVVVMHVKEEEEELVVVGESQTKVGTEENGEERGGE